MRNFSVDTPSSLAWGKVCELLDRPTDVLQEEWGVDVDARSLVGPHPDVDKRYLFARDRTLTLTRGKNGDEITACKELGPPRRFQVSVGESGQPLFIEQGSDAKSVHEVLNDLVSWLKESR